jgi:hypothetical protein
MSCCSGWPLNIMQWVAGIDAGFRVSGACAGGDQGDLLSPTLLVAGFDDFRAMKLAAGREQDLVDLRELGQRHGQK